MTKEEAAVEVEVGTSKRNTVLLRRRLRIQEETRGRKWRLMAVVSIKVG